MHPLGPTIARISAVLVASVVVGACDRASTTPGVSAHEKHSTLKTIAQRIMYCDDGTRANVALSDDGLKIAVTWLPRGRPEILRANSDGDQFRNDQSRAVVEGGTLAFLRGGNVRVCHRTPGDH
ncbi:hypothetical protein GS397_22835 [Sphingobium yanoikuyae]|uniref:C-type lysozyme inhibitor domain-containing protein n=1 Tax=Sphingobium yanoikuyae TaxID=13690 RepID=A0A6P1GLY8_SPHYA|nr:hypothetical protein [Sphingobium yanoikuyae]QHD69595.1 hypothetical protein GS397_22835 [Sphingobium yanoikuyae]